MAGRRAASFTSRGIVCNARRRRSARSRPCSFGSPAFAFLIAVAAFSTCLFAGCGVSASKDSTAASQATAEPTVWTCSMHPQIRRTSPGQCPICHMDLTPVAKWSDAGPSANGESKPASKTTPSGAEAPKPRESKSGESKSGEPQAGESSSAASPAAKDASVPDRASVVIPETFQQRIGVRIGRVEKGPLRMRVEALGIVRPDETRTAWVGVKTEGWIERLYVNFVGQTVRRGDPLLSIYSPRFLTTQQELLASMRSERNLGGDLRSFSEAARRRLELWDVPSDEIDRLLQSGVPQKELILRSPIDGTVLEKNVYAKQYVAPEKQLYVVADLSSVWVQAQIYEYEIPHVELGRAATVVIPSLPDRSFQGKVVFIQPTVAEAARTVQVRIELPNRDGFLKPGMFAKISIEHPMGDGLLVPMSAILRTGAYDIAYLAGPHDHFTPTAVKISPHRFGDRYQILAGLREGDRIATSGNFLIDSESRIRSGGARAAEPSEAPRSEPKAPAP